MGKGQEWGWRCLWYQGVQQNGAAPALVGTTGGICWGKAVWGLRGVGFGGNCGWLQWGPGPAGSERAAPAWLWPPPPQPALVSAAAAARSRLHRGLWNGAPPWLEKGTRREELRGARGLRGGLSTAPAKARSPCPPPPPAAAPPHHGVPPDAVTSCPPPSPSPGSPSPFSPCSPLTPPPEPSPLGTTPIPHLPSQ